MPGATSCELVALATNEVGSLRCQWQHDATTDPHELKRNGVEIVQSFRNCLKRQLAETMDSPPHILHGRLRGTGDWISVRATADEGEKKVTVWMTVNRHPYDGRK